MEQWDSFRGLFGRTRILWQMLSGFYCVGLDRLCPISIVPCVDYGVEYGLIEQRCAVRFHSLEEVLGRRCCWTASSIDRAFSTLSERIKTALRGQGTDHWALVSSYPSPTLEAFAAETGCRSACRSAELYWWPTDKANFYDGLRQLGLPRIRGLWRRLQQSRYKELASEFGSRLFAQLAVGGAGSGTAFIDSQSDFEAAALRFGDSPVWITPYLGELSLNLNAIAMETGAVVGYPSVQLVGFDELCALPGCYCGNDFSSTRAVPSEVLEDVRAQTERIGVWLASLGYKGLFGLDFVVDPSSLQAYAVDLNPRWQGSTALQTQGEYRAGRLPLAASELAYQLGALGESEIMQRADEFYSPIRGSQLLLRCRAPGWWEATGEVAPGVYSTAFEYARPGVRLSDLRSRDEVLVTGAIPRPHTPVAAGAPLFRICSEEPAMNTDRMKLLPWSEHAAREAYKHARLKPTDGEDPQEPQCDGDGGASSRID